MNDDALVAFFQEHGRCGPMDGDVEGGRAWVVCYGCGATFGEPGRWCDVRHLERLYALSPRLPRASYRVLRVFSFVHRARAAALAALRRCSAVLPFQRSLAPSRPHA